MRKRTSAVRMLGVAIGLGLLAGVAFVGIAASAAVSRHAAMVATTVLPETSVSSTPDEGCCEACASEPSAAPSAVSAAPNRAGAAQPAATAITAATAAPEERKADYTFTIKTDKDQKIIPLKPEDIKADPTAAADFINNVVAENDEHGCYVLRFDTRTAKCTEVTGTWKNAQNTTGNALPVLKSEKLRDRNGGEFTRYFVYFIPKLPNGTYTIAVKCLDVR